jgi:UDP-GlcNAc:undecaprenyl-phosphate GlcNAc-1-phosphate transferase
MPKALYVGGAFLPETMILGLAISFIITPFVRRLSLRARILDVPHDGRRMHKNAVPLAGGAGIIAAFLVSSAAFFAGGDAARLAVFCILCGIYGFFDDKLAFPVWAKLSFQAAVSFSCALTLVRAEAVSFFGQTIFLGSLSVPATAAWIAFMMNAVNLTDGMDGLCSGTSAVSAACLSILLFLHGDISFAVSAAALSGACLGFLFHNRAPAGIFMGETGSAFLGFALAVLSLPLFSAREPLSLFCVLPAVLFPVCEAASSFLRRIEKGGNPFAPDKLHMHHVLYARFGSVPTVCTVMYAFSLLCAFSALKYAREPLLSLLLFAFSVVFMRLMLARGRLFTLSPRRQRARRAEYRARQGRRRAR